MRFRKKSSRPSPRQAGARCGGKAPRGTGPGRLFGRALWRLSARTGTCSILFVQNRRGAKCGASIEALSQQQNRRFAPVNPAAKAAYEAVQLARSRAELFSKGQKSITADPPCLLFKEKHPKRIGNKIGIPPRSFENESNQRACNIFSIVFEDVRILKRLKTKIFGASTARTFVPHAYTREPLTIIILSFDRPHYLEKVLTSLVPQLRKGDEILLFQDGGWDRFASTSLGRDAAIHASISIFNKFFPFYTRSLFRVKKFISRQNLGIAGNYRRAETYHSKNLNERAFSCWKTISSSAPII